MKAFIIVALSISIFRSALRMIGNLAKDETAADYVSSLLVGCSFVAMYILALVFFVSCFNQIS